MSYYDLIKQYPDEIDENAVEEQPQQEKPPVEIQYPANAARWQAIVNHLNGRPYSRVTPAPQPSPLADYYAQRDKQMQEDSDYERDRGEYTPQDVQDVSAEDVARAYQALNSEQGEPQGGSEENTSVGYDSEDNAPSIDEQVQKVAEVAAGGNPYKVGAGLPSLLDVGMRNMGKYNPAMQANMAQTIGQQMAKAGNPKMAMPTDMTDPLYKLKLQSALIDSGRSRRAIDRILADESLNNAIKKAQTDEYTNAFLKAIGGGDVTGADLALSNLVSSNPQGAAMLASRMPGTRDYWNRQNSIDDATRNHDWNMRKADKDLAQKMAYGQFMTNEQLRGYMGKLGINSQFEQANIANRYYTALSMGASEQEARNFAFAGRGTTRNNGTSGDNGQLKGKEQEFVNGYEHRMQAAKEQLASMNMDATAISDMHNWLFENQDKFSPEQFNELYAPLYQIEEKWKDKMEGRD